MSARQNLTKAGLTTGVVAVLLAGAATAAHAHGVMGPSDSGATSTPSSGGGYWSRDGQPAGGATVIVSGGDGTWSRDGGQLPPSTDGSSAVDPRGAAPVAPSTPSGSNLGTVAGFIPGVGDAIGDGADTVDTLKAIGRSMKDGTPNAAAAQCVRVATTRGSAALFGTLGFAAGELICPVGGGPVGATVGGWLGGKGGEAYGNELGNAIDPQAGPNVVGGVPLVPRWVGGPYTGHVVWVPAPSGAVMNGR